MKFIITILLVFFIITIFSCDFEKFIDSKYDAQPLPTTAKIYGKVFNIFDSQPVDDAQILITNQATFTDTAGNYLFYYYFQGDEDRDKKIPISIKASRYIQLNTNSVIYPTNKLDFHIEYGAPIIQSIARIDSFCQAIIFDYQGYENIATVTGKFFYRRQGERVPSLITELAMTGYETDSTNIGFFQCKVDTSIPGYGSLIRTFYVYASDKHAFRDSTTYARSGVDTLLFPVNPI